MNKAKRFSMALVALLAGAVAWATPASAHFIFIVPAPNGASAQVIMSETLTPDPGVPVTIIGGAKLQLRSLDGKSVPLSMTKVDEQSYKIPLTGEGTRIVHGTADLGVRERGGKPHLLLYYPKTIVGDAFDARTELRDVPVELIPTKSDAGIRLKLLVKNKPQGDVEITIIAPDGVQEIVKTYKDGFSPVMKAAGRYGAWARHWEETPGEREGKKYEQVRHYAMLVFDNGAPPAAPAARPAVAAAPLSENVTKWTALPEQSSSFGAVSLDGWLYVYGGHIVPTHEYHTQAVSGKFHRIDLARPESWQSLPSGPALQGLNITAHEGYVYRIGGMQPRNKKEDPTENFSLDTSARFDPAKMVWEPLPSLPVPRSSHDLVFIDQKLYVMGGWNLKGENGIDWPDNVLVMDFAAPKLEWKSVPAPFKRRALIATTFNDKLFVIGGFDSEDTPQKRVDIFNPATGQWSTGPELPGAPINGFSPAACVHDRQLFISVGDGGFYRMNDASNAWEKIAQTTPRIVHRLVPMGGRILVIGGASRGANHDLIEAVTLPAPTKASAGAQ